jgi:hypothetical protein
MSDETFQRPIYQPKAIGEERRKKEWVQLGDGGWICCWSLTVADLSQALMRAERPALGDQPARIDAMASLVGHIQVSCHTGEEAQAPLVFQNPDSIWRLSLPEMVSLMEVINRLNGTDDVSLTDLRSFFETPQASTS